VSKQRAAIYLRVSKGDQHAENQRPDVERIIKQRGLELVELYEDNISAAAKRRPAFDSMVRDAQRGRFDVLVIWAIDRFGRSMAGNIQTVLDLDRRGVVTVSVQEPWLDTGGPVRDLLLAIFSWIAEQERTRLVERTNAGLDRARRKGIRLGRPPARVNLWLAKKLIAEGQSLRQVAKVLKVPLGTLHGALKRSENPTGAEAR